MEYYSVIKMNEVGIHVPKWMNLKNVGLSEKSQTQNLTYCMITLM